jgi:hypothetical protein
MKQVFCILFLVCSLHLLAQDEEIQTIMDLYEKTSEQILIAQQPDEEGFGPLYSNELIVNSNNNSWRAVGNYLKKITFWYTDQPSFAQYSDQTETSVLTKIEIETEASAMKYYSEYLFYNDQLVYFSDIITIEEGEKEELKYFFEGGKVFRFLKNNEISECEVCAEEVLQKAEEYKKLFLSTFN